VISCELNLGLHLSQGAGFHQVCLMFARCLLDRVNGVLRMCLSLCVLCIASCYRQLGMQSGAIPDSALRASSSYDDSSVGPSYGRCALPTAN